MGNYLVKELRRKNAKISVKTTIVGAKFSHKLILQAEYKKDWNEIQKIGLAAKELGLGRTGVAETHPDRDRGSTRQS